MWAASCSFIPIWAHCHFVEGGLQVGQQLDVHQRSICTINVNVCTPRSVFAGSIFICIIFIVFFLSFFFFNNKTLWKELVFRLFRFFFWPRIYVGFYKICFRHLSVPFVSHREGYLEGRFVSCLLGKYSCLGKLPYPSITMHRFLKMIPLLGELVLCCVTVSLGGHG